MSDTESKQLLDAQVVKEEYEILQKDFDFCTKLKTKHFDNDLQEILDQITELLHQVTKQHFIDLNLEKWYIEHETEPEVIRKKAEELKAMLLKLYTAEFEIGKGKVDTRVLPERKSLILKYIEKLKGSVDPKIIDQCYELLARVDRLSDGLIKHLDAIMKYSTKTGDRQTVAKLIMNMREWINEYVDCVVKLLNNISYIDSVTEQLQMESYNMDKHLVHELLVRYKIKKSIDSGKNVLEGQGGEMFKVFFIKKDDAAGLDAFFSRYGKIDDKAIASFAEKAVDIDKKGKVKFDGTQRYVGAFGLYQMVQMQYHKFYKQMFELFPKDAQIGPPKEGDTDLEEFDRITREVFDKRFFFNNDDYYVLLREGSGQLSCIRDKEEFINKILGYLVFHNFKDDSFDKVLNSVVEPFFMTHMHMLEFSNYKTGRNRTYKIIMDILDRQLEQGDITEQDHRQIRKYMDMGFKDLEEAQDSVVKELRSGIKEPKYINFINRPYLVHQLMVDVLRIAIVAEARAKFNENGELIYTGRESGFEGGNTVAVHGFNNYLKFKKLLSVVRPVMEKKLKVFDNFEHFKIWLLMGLHDSATYDRQNAISYSDSTVHQTQIKKAHNMIGAAILHENEIIRKLFRADRNETLGEERHDLNLMAAVIKNHDYPSIQLDIEELSKTLNPTQVKALVYYTLSGLADNSAGVGFLGDDGKVHVDPWEEKGSSLFVVMDKGKNSKKTNPELMWEILAKLKKDQDYYKKENHWENEILWQVKDNIDAMPDGIVKQKLIRGIQEKDFSFTSALWTAGVLNAGYIHLPHGDAYDGKTLKIHVVMDKEINEELDRIMGDDGRGFKRIYARIANFIKDYDKLYFNTSLKNLGPKTPFNILNADTQGKPIPGSIGIQLRILEVKGQVNKFLIEETSKALLDARFGELQKQEMTLDAEKEAA